MKEFGLLFLLLLAGCDTVGPSEPPLSSPDEGHVALQLSGNLQLLQDEHLSLVVAVLQDVEERPGPQEGDEQRFAPESNEYVVRDVKLGWKWFRIRLVDDADALWGGAEVRHLVTPGAQVLSAPVTIKVRPPSIPQVDTSVSFFVGIHQPGQTPKVTFVDIKPLFDKHHCLNCHYTDAAFDLGHGLDLSVFPFTSTNVRLPDFPAIADEVARSVVAFSFPMPPSPFPRLPSDEAALIEDWTYDGYLQYPPGADQTGDLVAKLQVRILDEPGVEVINTTISREDDQSPFVLDLPAVEVGSQLQWVVRVLTVDDRQIHRAAGEFQVPESGPVNDVSISVPYEAGEVSIPIVIEE